RYIREQQEARKLLEQANTDLRAMQDSLINIMDDLQTRNRYLARLNSLSDQMARCSNLEDLLKIAARAISEILDGTQVAIFLLSEDQKRLVLGFTTGDQEQPQKPIEIDIDETQMDFPTTVEKLDTEVNRLHKAIAQSIEPISGLVVPLVSKGHHLGVIVVAEKRWHRVFSEDEKDNIVSISSMLSVCMDNLVLMRSLTRHVEEISNLNEYISTVVDSIDIAVMVVDMDYKITMFNRGFQKLYGFDPKEFRGKNVFEAFPHLLEQGFGEVAQTIRSGKPFVRENWRRKILDGREVVQNIQIVPHRNASGEIIGAVALLSDITEKVKLEDQLDKSEAKFRKLVEELDDAYLIICDGTIAYANNAAAAITGFPVHQLLGSKPQRILIDKDLVNILEKCPAQKIRCESKVLHTSGIVVPVEASVYPCDYCEKSAASVVLRDITERKKIENQLAEKNREMRLRNEQITRLNEELEATVNRLKESQQSILQSERIAAITETAIAMSHEINGPLFAILGQAQLLLRKYGEEDQDLIKRLRMIEESVLKIACATKKLANMADPVIQNQPNAEWQHIPAVDDQ
ncbi:MAG: PAS domain S-box protein, partial [bacterium]